MYVCRTVCCLSWCVLHNSVLAFLMKKVNSARRNTPKQALGVGEGGGGGGGDDEVVAVEIQPDEVIQTEGSREKEDEFDWWSKFYASLDNSPLSQVEYEQAGYDKLVVCVHVRVCGVVCIRAGDKRITQVCYSTYIHDEQQYMYVVYILSAHIRTNVENSYNILSFISHAIQVYPGPLENQFDHFQDLLSIYPLYHGKGQQGEEENTVGNLKVSPRSGIKHALM